MVKVRIRHAGGASTIEVPMGSSAGDIAHLIEAELGSSMPHASQVWKTGYPPRHVPRRKSTDIFPLDGVDMIHVSCSSETSDSPTVDFLSEVLSIIEEPSLTDPEGIIIRRVMDADNSCLFNSIGYLLLNRSRKDSKRLRQMVTDTVREDPVTFTEALLGRAPEDYISFISDPKAWGGQIELLIFSRIFRTEIAACDIIRDRVDIYGAEEGYMQRVFVIYDGIHYDSLSFTFDESLPEDMDVTRFSPKDDAAFAKASALCSEQHRKKAFTDTSNFTLRFAVCQEGFVGANGAQKHAEKTGHSNFAEF